MWWVGSGERAEREIVDCVYGGEREAERYHRHSIPTDSVPHHTAETYCV